LVGFFNKKQKQVAASFRGGKRLGKIKLGAKCKISFWIS